MVQKKQATGHSFLAFLFEFSLPGFQLTNSEKVTQWVLGFKIIIWISVMANLLHNYYCFIFTNLGVDCLHDMMFMTITSFSRRNPAHMQQDCS